MTASSVLLTVTADRAWTGTLHFDYPRHRDHLHLPINYPRLNEWPEWFTVEHDRRYEVRVGDGPPASRLGAELVQGLAVTLKEGESVRIRVNDGGAPPYGR